MGLGDMRGGWCSLVEIFLVNSFGFMSSRISLFGYDNPTIDDCLF